MANKVPPFTENNMYAAPLEILWGLHVAASLRKYAHAAGEPTLSQSPSEAEEGFSQPRPSISRLDGFYIDRCKETPIARRVFMSLPVQVVT